VSESELPMPLVEHVPVEALDPHRFQSVLAAQQYEDLVELIDAGSRALRGRVVWNVNSTASGGGVVELLRPLLGYSRGGGVDARWVVISGDPAFFTVTKRLHNRLHGFRGDPGLLGADEHRIYDRTLAANAAELIPLIHRGDIVILHDPQTAGLVEPVSRTGATLIWRCHVGRDHVNAAAREAWTFLRPYVAAADAFVFSRSAFVWDGLPEQKIAVIPPSIDAFSPKNAEQTPAQSRAILDAAGIVPAPGHAAATYTRWDGTPGRVDRRAAMVEEASLSPDDRVVMQVSRWDRLKDPIGVLRAFARDIAPRTDAHLLLVGPATGSVADDPEGAVVLDSVRHAWGALPVEVRRRVHLASLPMDDAAENAAVVNALQRHADVVVQKSLAEGFGLTVAEAMWKARPVVASRIGGIEDQIVQDESGLLVADPRDRASFADAVLEFLADPDAAARIGAAARERIRQHFLAPQHLARYFDLIQRTISAAPSGELAGAQQ
jgi:trehalose synthase